MKKGSSTAKLLFAVLLCMPLAQVQANSVGFGSSTFVPQNGQLSVTLVFDFTDFSMAGGGFDLLYDPEALEFVSFDVGPPPTDVVVWGSGAVVDEGRVTDLFLSTFFFFGINSSGLYGTVVFNVLSDSIGDPGCNGFELCLVENPNNPLQALTGKTVTDQLLEGAQARVVPLPGAIWLLSCAMSAFLFLRKPRRSKTA